MNHSSDSRDVAALSRPAPATSIRSCRYLYKILTAKGMEELRRIEREPAGVSRRYWDQPRGATIDTTARMHFLTATQVPIFLAGLELVRELGIVTDYWMIILDRQMPLVEGGPNKLTIEERVEFTVDNEEGDGSIPLEGDCEERYSNVLLWGWLDTATEVLEKRQFFRDEKGELVVGELRR